MRYRVDLFDRLLTVTDLAPGVARSAKTAPRGIVKGISNKSRTRLLRIFAKVRRTDPAWFVTLTYREFSESFTDWKRHLKLWHECAARRYPDHAGLWRLQFQDRGAAHFHVLLWTLKPDESKEDFESWASCTWLRIIGQHTAANRAHGVLVESVNDIRGCGFYLALYTCSGEQDRKDIATGREWGVWKKSEVIGAAIEQTHVSEDGLKLLRRIVGRCGAAWARLNGRKKRSHFWDSLKRQQPFSRFLPFEESTRLVRWVNREADGMAAFVLREKRERNSRRQSRGAS